MKNSRNSRSSRDSKDSRNKKGPSKKRTFVRKKKCKFCMEKIEDMDYKDISRLGRLTTERGKILPRRISGTCAGHQRIIMRAIKRAREIALMPYIAGYR